MLGLVDEGISTKMWSIHLLPLVKAPWNGCEMFLSCINVVKRLLRMPVNTLPKQLLMEMGL